MEGLPVYGVAIPTEVGLRNVLTLIGGKHRRAIWHNMREVRLRRLDAAEREACGGRGTIPQDIPTGRIPSLQEPLVYINGNPYVLREVERCGLSSRHS